MVYCATIYARERQERLEVELLDSDFPKANLDQFVRQLIPEGVGLEKGRWWLGR